MCTGLHASASLFPSICAGGVLRAVASRDASRRAAEPIAAARCAAACPTRRARSPRPRIACAYDPKHRPDHGRRSRLHARALVGWAPSRPRQNRDCSSCAAWASRAIPTRCGALRQACWAHGHASARHSRWPSPGWHRGPHVGPGPIRGKTSGAHFGATCRAAVSLPRGIQASAEARYGSLGGTARSSTHPGSLPPCACPYTHSAARTCTSRTGSSAPDSRQGFRTRIASRLHRRSLCRPCAVLSATAGAAHPRRPPCPPARPEHACAASDESACARFQTCRRGPRALGPPARRASRRPPWQRAEAEVVAGAASAPYVGRGAWSEALGCLASSRSVGAWHRVAVSRRGRVGDMPAS